MALQDATARKLPSDPTPAYRAAPHNIEAEQALLGAILVNNEAFYRVSDFLEPAHFFEPLHQTIFDLGGSLIRAGKVATPVTLKTFLPADLDIGGLNASQYLARLAAEATTVINAADYGHTIYDLAIRRSLIVIGEDMVNVAFDAPVDFAPQEQIEDAERRLYELAETGKLRQRLPALRVRPDHRRRHGGARLPARRQAVRPRHRTDAISTGMMGGLQPSDLVILAGRPGMGKTALATNIAYNIAKALARRGAAGRARLYTVDGGIVGFFSLEMSAEQLATRIISEQTGIPSYRIRRGEIDPIRFRPNRCDCAREMETIPLYIDETGGLSIAQLAARARRLKRQRGLDLVVVDYIQLLSGSTRRALEGRVQEVTEITTSLKALAKELNVPILALSQLSRQVENRDDKRPQLSDLRESGSIEQDADVVMFVFREEYYLKNREPRAGTRGALQVAGRDGGGARQGRGHHRQAAPRADRHRRSCSSRPT